MTTNLKNILGLAALGMTLLTNTVPTWAGSVGTHDTVVGSNYAYGSMVGARYSADNTQSIGCYLDANTANSGPYISCVARDSAGHYISCSGGSNLPVNLEILQGMTSSSDIYFEREPSRGVCRNISIYNGSTMLR